MIQVVSQGGCQEVHVARSFRLLCSIGGSVIVVAAMSVSMGAGVGAASSDSSPGVTSSTITIGMMDDETGVAASTTGDGVGAAQARIDLQNKEGGVNGHKLKLVAVDTQSSPTQVTTAAKDLVENQHVFGIISDSAFTFAAAKYLTSQGVPVAGEAFDGPEWGTSANMFTDTPPTYTTYPNGKSYNYLTLSNFLKSEGVTKPAVLGYNISPSATLSLHQVVAADTAVGLKNCLEDGSIPFGSANFTSLVLQLKQLGCNGVVGTFVASSNVGLATAIAQAGLHLKQFYYTSYGQGSITNAGADSALQGTFTQGSPTTGSSPTVKALNAEIAALKKYDHSYPGGIPDLGASVGWLGADTMIAGLKEAGTNPTRASFESKLRATTNYTMGGTSATPVSFNYLTGKFPASECITFITLKEKQFVAATKKPTCGKLFAYSGT
jgi:branched-chain amino acid transport system substrate-binding protein